MQIPSKSYFAAASKSSKPLNQGSRSRIVALVTAGNSVCPLCSSNHILARCKKFKSFAINDRIAQVKRLKACFNCLRTGYGTKECNSGSYRQCKEKHHTLIYVAKKPNKTLRTGETEEEVFASTVSLTITMLSNESCFPPPLSTFWTRLESMNVELCWIKAHRWTLSRPRSQIASTFPICRVERSFWMYERLITRIPNFRLSESAIRVPPHITLADSQFCTPRDVNLINGQLWDIMCTINWGRCYPFL